MSSTASFLRPALAFGAAILMAACSANYVTVPPRMDLKPYGRVALVTFTADDPSSPLSARASERFVERMLESQYGIEIIELDARAPELGGLDPATHPAELAKALGKRRAEIPAVFVGHLGLSDVQPSGGLAGVGDFQMRASVSASLRVQLLSTGTGGTLWRGSAQGERTVGSMEMSGGRPSVSLRDVDEVWDEVLNDLVWQATWDFRPTRAKQ